MDTPLCVHEELLPACGLLRVQSACRIHSVGSAHALSVCVLPGPMASGDAMGFSVPLRCGDSMECGIRDSPGTAGANRQSYADMPSWVVGAARAPSARWSVGRAIAAPLFFRLREHLTLMRAQTREEPACC